jgi:hypothetical protein
MNFDQIDLEGLDRQGKAVLLESPESGRFWIGSALKGGQKTDPYFLTDEIKSWVASGALAAEFTDAIWLKRNFPGTRVFFGSDLPASPVATPAPAPEAPKLEGTPFDRVMAKWKREGNI